MRGMEELSPAHSSSPAHSLAGPVLYCLTLLIAIPIICSMVSPSCIMILALSVHDTFPQWGWGSEYTMLTFSSLSFNSQVPSQALPRRLATAPKTEKPPARKKSGHPAPSSMRSRGGIWR